MFFLMLFVAALLCSVICAAVIWGPGRPSAVQDGAGLPPGLKPASHGGEPFDNIMDMLAEKYEGEWFSSKVIGLTAQNEEGPSRQRGMLGLDVMAPLELVPEPECAHDRCAIKVATVSGQAFGYLPAHVAKEVSLSLAKGVTWRCYVKEVFMRKGSWEMLDIDIGLLHYFPVTDRTNEAISVKPS